MKMIVCCALILCAAASVGGEEKKSSVPLAFRIGEMQPGQDLTEMTVFGSAQTIYLHKETLLANADVASARVQRTGTGYDVEVTLTESGKTKLARITKQNIGKSLGIVVDGKLISAPRIMAAMEGGMAVITGKFSRDEARRIADGIAGR